MATAEMDLQVLNDTFAELSPEGKKRALHLLRELYVEEQLAKIPVKAG